MFSSANTTPPQPWLRLWLPEAQWSVQRGIDDDFMHDHGQPAGIEHMLDNPIPGVGCLRDFASVPFLFLLGRPGSGKSHDLQMAADLGWFGLPCRKIEGKEIGHDIAGTLDREVGGLPAPVRLIIDGLDEALLEHPNFVPELKRWLRQRLGKDGIPTVRLAISCRWADWPAQSVSELAALWPVDQTKCLVLCPLRRSDVVETLRFRFGDDAEVFWAQMHTHHLSSVACWPQGLLGLMEQFESSGRKSICNSYTQAVVDQITRHCRLTDTPDDRGRWMASLADTDWRKRIAGRVAAAMLWSSKSRLNLTDPSPSSDSLTLADLQHSEEPWESLRKPVHLEDLNGLMLKSRLMRRLTDNIRWVFQSQVHQESLAADWLNAQDLDEPRMMQLFGKMHEGQWCVQPALGAVAAWFASKNALFRRILLSHDPLVLLRMDGASLADQERMEIVDALLKTTERIRVVDPSVRQAHLVSLNHEGLHEQLEAWLRRTDVCDATKELAIEIAEKTQTLSLAPVLWELYPQTDSRLQIEMAGALSRLSVGPEHDSNWQSVLRGEFTLDRHGTLLGAALDSQVISGKMPVRDVLQWVIPGRHFEMYGLFDMTVRNLPEKLTPADLPAVFAKLGEHPRQITNNLETPSLIHKAAIKLAITHSDQPTIAQALCDYWFTCLAVHVHPHHRYNDTWNREELGIRDEAHRRAIVRELIHHPGFALHTERKYLWGREYLVTDEDFDWSLEQLFLAAPADQWRWSLILTHSLMRIDLSGERGDKLQKAWETIASVRSIMPRPIEGESVAQALRRVESEARTKRESEKAGWDKQHEERQSAFQANLSAYTEDCKQAHERGELTWSDAYRILSARAHGPSPCTITFEPLTKIGPGDEWMVESAVRFLRELPSKRPVELSDGIDALLALAACLDHVETDPALRAAIGQHWLAPLIADFSMSYLDKVPDGLSWEKFGTWFPEYLPAACDTVIRDRYLKSGQLGELRSFRKLGSSELSERVAKILREEPIQAAGFFNALRFLAEENGTLATEVCRGWLAGDQSSLNHDQLAVLLGTSLLLLEGRLTAEIRDSHALDNNDLAKDSIWRAVHYLWFRDDNIDFSSWPDEAVCYFAEVCGRAYPQMERRRSGGFRWSEVTDSDKAIQLRDRIVNEATQRGLLLTLPQTYAQDSPDEAKQRLRSLDRHRNEASKARLLTQREVLKPEVFFPVCSVPSARLARNADELMAAVMESLRRWEQSIAAGGWQRLWDLKPLRSRDGEDIATEMREWLTTDLKVFSEREVELSSMTRTDILVQTLTGIGLKLTVVIELKKLRKSNAKERRTSMESQLRDSYLKERLAEGWTHGLYVVAWTPEPGSAQDSPEAIVKEQSQLAEQASKLSEGPYRLQGMVIDARSRGSTAPSQKPPSRRIKS